MPPGLPYETLRTLSAAFEPRRQAALSAQEKRRLYVYIGVPIIFGIAALVVWRVPGAEPGAMFLPMMAAPFAWAWAARPVRQYKSLVKEEAFPAILKTFGEDFHHEERGRIPMDDLKRSGLIPHHDKARFEDYIAGSWSGLQVDLVEAELIDEQGSGKDRRDVTVFDGLFVRFSVHKRFSGHTIVKADRGVFNRLGGLGSRLERVRLEDPEFEKEFEVYSTDQVEARYLLTLTFMERLRRLSAHRRQEAGGRGPVQLAFYDDRLLVMMPCRKNRFEVGDIRRPDHLAADMQGLLSDMEQVFSIAETLRLDDDSRL